MKLKKNIAVSQSGFLFDVQSGTSYSVNEIGQKIMELLRDDKDENEMKRLLLEMYEVSPIELERDLFEFIAQSNDFQLIEA